MTDLTNVSRGAAMYGLMLGQRLNSVAGDKPAKLAAVAVGGYGVYRVLQGRGGYLLAGAGALALWASWLASRGQQSAEPAARAAIPAADQQQGG